MSILIKGTNIEDLQRAMLMFRGHEIIELPDHGDLVDVDEVMKTASEMAEYWETEYELPRILQNAPVVIPAERSEE